MFEKVNPHHPDKLCDRIGGRLVDLAYTRAAGGWAVSRSATLGDACLSKNPTIAGEITIGHGAAFVAIEGNADITEADVRQAVSDIAHISPDRCTVILTPQDPHLAQNQAATLRCGDNGIFRGCPVTEEQRLLTALAKTITEAFPTDGKYVLTCQQPDGKQMGQLTICQSQATKARLDDLLMQWMPMDASWLRNPETGRVELIRLPQPYGRLHLKVNPPWATGPAAPTWTREP